MNNKTKLEKLILGLLILQALVNLIGALGPELGFDALWYHLTEAKLFIQNKSINPISGNLLYWSGLPRLGEIIYAGALAIFDERLTKLIHWSFGIFSTHLTYQLARRYLNKLASLSASLLFYSSLLVGWLSTTSYIDLMVTAWLLLALVSKRWWARGLSLILASATKLHALVIGLSITLIPWGILGVLPFAIINKLTFNNFFYPFFENFGFSKEYFLNGLGFWFSRPIRLFLDPDFRVGPFILILFLLNLKNQKIYLKVLLASFFIWWLGPGTGFGRFSLFFLSILCINATKIFDQKKLLLLPTLLLLIHSLVGITGRAYGNQKYLSYLLGQQSKTKFLTQNLKFHFGDFYDTDNWFNQNIKPTDKVLVYDVHNLYYLDFPYDHHTWADSKTEYSHILVGNNQALPAKFGKLPLLYQNSTTKVNLYLNEQNP